MSVLDVKNLTKKYPSFTLDGVSFSLEEGKITGFIGRNGAGKSTTLKALFGFVHSDGGEVSFFGEPLASHEDEVKSKTGFLLGEVNYYQNKKISKITEITRAFYPEWDEGAYRRYMSLFGIDEAKKPSELSAGMKVKYSLALALSHGARLLVLDEPTSGLDPVSRDELLEIFITLCREGITILFSTHITSDLDRCADNIIYIKNGRIIADGALDDIKRAYRVIRYDSLPRELSGKVIGQKTEKTGCSALIKAKDIVPDIASEAATLEDIMVHMERSGENA